MEEHSQNWLYQRIVDGAPDAIIFSDISGLIRLWNSGAENIFGYSSDEAIGQSLDLIIPERLRARHWEGYRKVMGHRFNPLWQRVAGGPRITQGRLASIH